MSEYTVETRTATGEHIGHERLTFCYKCSVTFFALTALHELILAAVTVSSGASVPFFTPRFVQSCVQYSNFVAVHQNMCAAAISCLRLFYTSLKVGFLFLMYPASTDCHDINNNTSARGSGCDLPVPTRPQHRVPLHTRPTNCANTYLGPFSN